MSRENIDNTLAKLWRERVVSRDMACQWNERARDGRHTTGIAAHHVILKSRAKHLQYDPRNGITLCTACHLYVHSGGETLFGMFFSGRWPETWDYLTAERYKYVKANAAWKREQLAKLKGYYERNYKM